MPTIGIGPAADREIQLARTLAPNDPDVLFIAAVQAQNLGRWDDALKFINASLALDPLNPPGYMVFNFVQLGRGRLEEAEAAIRRTVELNPTFTHAHYFLRHRAARARCNLNRRWRRWRRIPKSLPA